MEEAPFLVEEGGAAVFRGDLRRSRRRSERKTYNAPRDSDDFYVLKLQTFNIFTFDGQNILLNSEYFNCFVYVLLILNLLFCGLCT